MRLTSTDNGKVAFLPSLKISAERVAGEVCPNGCAAAANPAFLRRA
jgi:hypothetical protein